MGKPREPLQIKNLSVVHHWTQDFARRHHAIPFHQENEKLYIAVAQRDQADLELALGRLGAQEYQYRNYPRNEILRAINWSYGMLHRKEKLQQDMRDWIAKGEIDQVFQGILDEAMNRKATDVHIWFQEGFYTIQFRLQGLLKTFCMLDKAAGEALSRVIKVWGKMEISATLHPRDGRMSYPYEGRRIDIRISLVPAITGEKIHMRLLNIEEGPSSLEDLCLQSQEQDLLQRYLHMDQGYLLVCGPTGSGKSTTMRLCLQEIHTGDKHIVSLEDPVEYLIKGMTQIQVDEERGNSFASLLRSTLRQDPDIIALGEVRDYESADVSIKASLTGHLMLGTMHTKSALSALERIIDLGVSKYMAVSAIGLILNQRLVKILCPHCKESYQAPEEIAALGIEKGAALFRPVGCEACEYTGYSSRQAVLELLPIREKTAAAFLEKGILEPPLGFVPIAQKLTSFVRRGDLSVEEAKGMISEESIAP